MTAVHQFVPALLPRDATGDHTLALREAFRRAGWESDIYVEAAHDELLSEAAYFEEYPSRARDGDVLLYQLSTGSPMADFLAGRPEPLVLDYHNITPPELYDGWEPETASKVAAALDQVAVLAPLAVLGIADSAFNAGELDALGCTRTEVVPILFDIESWAGEPDPLTRAERARARRRAGGPVWLFVGRLSPNKAQHELLAALWVARRTFDPRTRLHLVGPGVTPRYVHAVAAYAEELGLTGAVDHGEDLTPAELAAWYAEADVFVCLSDHEGFCIPLLEAMRFELPIVAFGAGAVPETLGDAGLLLDSKRPATVAAAADRVVRDATVRTTLVGAGHRRLEAFDPARTRRRFVDVLAPLAQARSVA